MRTSLLLVVISLVVAIVLGTLVLQALAHQVDKVEPLTHVLGG